MKGKNFDEHTHSSPVQDSPLADDRSMRGSPQAIPLVKSVESVARHMCEDQQSAILGKRPVDDNLSQPAVRETVPEGKPLNLSMSDSGNMITLTMQETMTVGEPLDQTMADLHNTTVSRSNVEKRATDQEANTAYDLDYTTTAAIVERANDCYQKLQYFRNVRCTADLNNNGTPSMSSAVFCSSKQRQPLVPDIGGVL